MDNGNDQLILVDVFDLPVGQAGKMEAHQKGLLHRAFSVFLFDAEGRRLLMQKRAAGKYHSAGLWANTCCSHPRWGEAVDEAALRRLREETGLVCSLEEIFSFVYREVYADGLSEYEYDHVFVGFFDGEISQATVDPEEIAELQWMDLNAVAKGLQENPGAYGDWFITAAPGVFQWLQKNEGRL